MLTEFGKVLRKARIDKGVLMKDMADAVGVSSAFLSSVETGRKQIPDGLFEKAARFLGFEKGTGEWGELKDAELLSRGEVSLPTLGVSRAHQDAALAFARRFEEMDVEELDKILNILHSKKD